MATTVSTFLRLVLLNVKEPFLKWEDFCTDPKSLFEAFSQYYAVEAKFLENIPSIIISEDVPTPEDRSKIWIKTSAPYGIGILIEGEYQMDYGMQGYPVGTPFLHSSISPLIEGLTKLTSQEITDYGLTDTVSGAKKRMSWYLFIPPTISV